jgi:hypothetical protein
MKKLTSLLILLVLSSSVIWAQKALPRGINYQAIMRDASGKLLTNQPVELRFSFSKSESESQIFYAEIHQVTTNALGLVNLVIGEGKATDGNYDNIPWSQGSIWFGVEADLLDSQGFNLLGKSPMLSVPYAFHSNTATNLVESPNSVNEGEQKNQSIYWHTGGNTATRPENHFAGTRDNQNFVIGTNLKTRMIFTKEGQLQIKSGVDGPKDSRDSYPLVIEGSKQGIWITVKGNRSNDNNFVTFADGSGTVWGRIEGETLAELEANPKYINENAIVALQVVALIAKGVGVGIEVAGYYTAAATAGATIIFSWQVPNWIVAAVGATAKLAAYAAELAAFILETDKLLEERRNSVGVSYASGAGDYAEWLPREEKERDLLLGEIVGVRGGVVSLNTNDADHFMVVSTRPAVLGNSPQEKSKAAYEKIAFMGQVPVKVLGKVEVGDYIIPSGNSDGVGIAVNPKKLATADFSKIVGVAWEASNTDLPILNYIKIGVGIKKNDLAPKVEELSNKVDNIMAYLEGKGPLRPDGAVVNETMTDAMQAKSNSITTAPTMDKLMDDNEFDRLIDQNADLINDLLQETNKVLRKHNFDFNKYPGIAELFNNPIPNIKALRRNPTLASKWAQIDASLLQKR